MTNEELLLAGKLPALWEAVKKLLYGMAWSFYTHNGKDRCDRHGVTLEDLQQESYFAFLDAVRAYKPEKGFRFTSYLSRHAMNHFRACMGIVRKLDALNYADSMNTPAAEDSETESGDLIPDPAGEAPLEAVDDKAEQEYFRQLLESVLSELSSIQAAVIRGKYYRQQKQTIPQIAESLHVTPQDVRRELGKGLQELRGKKQVWEIKRDYLETAAFHGTGWNAWNYEHGSVEERTIEGMEKKGWIR